MTTDTALTVPHANALSLDQNPAAVYLASLAPTGRRSMTARLRSAAYGSKMAVCGRKVVYENYYSR